MAQKVKMPDGVVVAFPDDMPKEEIRALIEEKFPQAAPKQAQPLPAADVPEGFDKLPAELQQSLISTSKKRKTIGQPVDFLEAGGGLTPEEEATGDWHRALAWPYAGNDKTGEIRFATPELVQNTYEGIKSAVTLPGDVMAGKYDADLGPGESFKDVSSELIGRGLDYTGATLGGGGNIPKSATLAGKDAVAGLKLSEQFEVPLTKGQASGDIKQLTKEEILRQTDNAGQKIIRGFDDRQRSAIEAAANKVGPAGDADNMAELVQGGLRDKVSFSKQRTASLYKIAEDGGAEFDPEAVRALPGFVKSRLEEGNFIIDDQLTPTAARALKEIEDAGNMAGGLTPRVPEGGAPVVGSDGVESFAVTLKGLEQVRKRITGLSGTSATDARALSAVKRSYDAWLDDVVEQGLMSGDDAALDALKTARAETQVYKGLTAPKAGDQATLRVKKMQDVDATAEEVANWLYGANVANPSLSAPKVAAKLKTTFGADSPEFQAIRASAWMRLIKDLRTGEMLSATKVSNRIDDFLNAKGETLSSVLFTADERAKMQAFSALLKKTITPKDATNPSRTAFTLKSMFSAGIQAAAGAVGLSTGGAPGGFAALLAVPVFRNVASVRAATKAIGPIKPKWAGRRSSGLGLGAAARGATLAPSTSVGSTRNTLEFSI